MLMRTCARIAIATALALTLAVAMAACGGNGSTDGSGDGSAKGGGTITVLAGTAPDSLDPQLGYTTQSAEALWLAYTPLLAYRHASGTAGGELIPGLATDLPKISKDGKTYDFTLRKGLTFSDGTPVRASDFAYTVQRILKVNWAGKSFFTNYIVGAADYDAGKAKSISGITTDDATGRITIKLTKAYGAFANVLAFPNAGLVPSGTPMKAQSTDLPPGVGAYTVENVVPNRGFQLKKNPKFASFEIPDIPVGNLDTIDIKINANTQSAAQQVLNNQADIFDYGDTVPPAVLPQIRSKASDRFATVALPSTFFFFLNTTKAPFNNLKARQAVNYAIDREAMVRLASGFLKPSCYFIPEGVVGHPDKPCPYGDTPDLAKAKQLVQESGMAGTPVTVWGQERHPRREYVDYYTDLLNKIGFKATEKIIADDTYFLTIGNDKTDPQTGFADWIQDFPNPSDFYFLMDGRAIQPTNNQNFSKVNDPFIQTQLQALDKVPSTELTSVASRWQALDEYAAQKAYVVAYGAESVPKFYSDKIDWDSGVFHPVYGTDFSLLKLK
jgi:peptide/nickel transport system substrate-binding protein